MEDVTSSRDSSKQIVDDCYRSEYPGGLASAAQLLYSTSSTIRPVRSVSGIHANGAQHTYTHEAFVRFVSSAQHRSASRSRVRADVGRRLRQRLVGGAVHHAVELRGGTLQQCPPLLSEISDDDHRAKAQQHRGTEISSCFRLAESVV